MSSKKELIDKQPRFWGLIAGGSTLTAACEAVGVHRATGRKWRQATGGRIPRGRPEPSGRYLSLEERLQIADLYLGGAGVRAIAVGIGRSASTVSRELRRNGSAPTAGEVCAVRGAEAGRAARPPAQGQQVRPPRAGDRGAIKAVREERATHPMTNRHVECRLTRAKRCEEVRSPSAPPGNPGPGYSVRKARR